MDNIYVTWYIVILKNETTSTFISFDYSFDGLIATMNEECFMINDAINNGIILILSNNCYLQFHCNDTLHELIYGNERLFTIYSQYGSKIINVIFQLSLYSYAVKGSNINFSKSPQSNSLKILLIGKVLL